jgi:hypothetical protein
MRAPRTRIATIMSLGILAVVALVAVLALRTVALSDGPLRPGPRFDVELPLKPGETITWGSALPENTTTSSIQIESIEPVDAKNIEIVGIDLNDPSEGAVGTAYGFPPAGIEAAPMSDATPRRLDPDDFVQVLVGVRLPGTQDGVIGGLRVAYRYEGRRYETVLPYGLRLRIKPDS